MTFSFLPCLLDIFPIAIEFVPTEIDSARDGARLREGGGKESDVEVVLNPMIYPFDRRMGHSLIARSHLSLFRCLISSSVILTS